MSNPYNNAAAPTRRDMEFNFESPLTPEEIAAEKSRREAYLAERNDIEKKHLRSTVKWKA